MADWLEICQPVNGIAIRDAAIDGGDLRLAAMAILADPTSTILPEGVTERLGKLAFDHGEVTPIDQKQITAIADYLDKRRTNV